ncbi:MAG: hypothetical protein SVT56_07425 [Chloroflexota bacterium]|jgi:hypothetical protein|nr:hypothetical protein [Chloroflexota bacterium]
MSYWIHIFNQQLIGDIDSENIKAAITTSNFHTLCEQYQLDPGSIKPALENLDIIKAPVELPLMFLLRYRREDGSPIPVYQWAVDSQAGAEMLNATLERAKGAIKERLVTTSNIVAVELCKSQLQDMGLLLGYELARWAAEQGNGLIYGLDAEWYYLNRHQAFIPIPEA